MLAAAHNQALPTWWLTKHIEKQIETSICRLCREKEKATFCVGATKQQQKSIKKIHDGVANIVRWNLTKQCGFKTTKKQYDPQTETVLGN